MEYTPQRVLSLTSEVPWGSNDRLRILWIQLQEQNRDQYASELRGTTNDEAIIPIVLRQVLFTSANAVLSDVNRLLQENRQEFENISGQNFSRITVLLLSKEPFSLPQVSSPITLPTWLPVLGGRETSLRISDLEQQANVRLLNCPEIRVDEVSELIYRLEKELVGLFDASLAINKNSLTSVLAKLFSETQSVSPVKICSAFNLHLEKIHEPRMYRPPAKQIDSLLSRLLYLVKVSSPDQIGSFALAIHKALGSSASSQLKPTLFAVMLRPDPNVCREANAMNWHAIFLAIYQGYHLMNGAAHAGEYGAYPVGLIYSTSLELRRFLRDASQYVSSLKMEMDSLHAESGDCAH